MQNILHEAAKKHFLQPRNTGLVALLSCLPRTLSKNRGFFQSILNLTNVKKINIEWSGSRFFDEVSFITVGCNNYVVGLSDLLLGPRVRQL